MTSAFDHVYLSPHLDDAAFSCGGAIAAQCARGERVIVVTLCTAAPTDGRLLPAFIEEAYRRAGATVAEVVEVRRAEDRRAMLGADALRQKIDEYARSLGGSGPRERGWVDRTGCAR